MSTRAWDVVVFDWDGTLADSTGLIAEAILRAAQDIDVPVPDPSLASHVIGLGLAEALALVVPDLPRERIPAFAARYHAHFHLGEAHTAFSTALSPCSMPCPTVACNWPWPPASRAPV